MRCVVVSCSQRATWSALQVKLYAPLMTTYTPAEAAALAAMPDALREAAFVRLWCAKEAVLKAHGQGLSFGLHRLEFAERGDALALVDCDAALGQPQDWSLHAFEPAPGYLATLAWSPLPTARTHLQ